jgi:hypothetical protein
LCGVFGDGFALFWGKFFHASGDAAPAQAHGRGIFLFAGHDQNNIMLSGEKKEIELTSAVPEVSRPAE